jgi:hypothetical protein
MMDDARRGARSFVLAAPRALHLAPFLVVVRDGEDPRDRPGKVS